MNILGLKHLRYFIFGLLGSLISTQAVAGKQPSITLIIDDLGYHKRNGERAINLPGPVTLAILPHTPHSKKLAKLAYQKGKTVMLHVPMTNILKHSPGPGTLSPDMNKETFMAELRRSLASIPHIQGLNNHMGSELTQDSTRMQWVMEETAKRGLFFVDSRTTAKSVAEKEAKKAGIPVLSRDIFLDHVRTEEAVNAAFDTMIKKARHYGHMIAIGHPYNVTLNVLEKRLPELQKLGVRLISVPEQMIAQGQQYQPADTLMASHHQSGNNQSGEQTMPSPAPRLNQAAAGSEPDKEIAIRDNRSAAPLKAKPELAPVSPETTPAKAGYTPAPVKPVAMSDSPSDISPIGIQPVKTPAMLQDVPVQHWDTQIQTLQ